MVLNSNVGSDDSAVFTGNVTGDVTGNTTGNTTGDITGDVKTTAADGTASVVLNSNVGSDDSAVFTGNVTGDVTGNTTGNTTGDITGDVKTTAADGTASVVLNSNVGSDDSAVFTGNVTGDVTGNTTGNTTGDITGDVKTTAADGTASVVLNSNVGSDDSAVFTGNVTGDVTGNTTGNTTGDITGDVKTTAADGTASVVLNSNVGSDDSAVFTGNVTGDVTGNTTGNTTGDITGDVKTTAADGTASVVLNSNVGSDDSAVFTGNVTGNVTGDVTGNTTGNTTGDITGDVLTTAANGDVTKVLNSNVGSDSAATFTGNVIGDITGNATGDITGDVLTTAANGDVTKVLNSNVGSDSAATFTGNVTGNVTGNITGNVVAAGSVDITGAAGLILENDETITNSTDGTVLITAPITKASAALEVVGASTLTGNVTAAGDLAVAGSTALTGGLSLSSATASNPVLEIKNTIGDNATSGILQFVKAKTTLSSDGDDAGVILFKADNTAVEQISFGEILVEVSESDDTDEAGKFSLLVASSDGSNTSLKDGLVLVGSPTANKVDVTIGAGASSVVTAPGNLAVAGTLSVGGAFTIPASVGSSGQMLKVPASGTVLEWETVTIDDLSDAKLGGANFTGGLSIGHAMTAATLGLANYNTAIGVTALDALTEGDLNVAVGYNALTANTTGTGNTAIGYEALKENTIGSYNVAFGNKAGNTIDNGSSNVVIGGDADVDDADASNRIVIGKSTIGLDNNTVTLGNGYITNWLPTDDGEVSLGKASLEFQDAYFDGTVTSDAFAGPLTGNVTGNVSGTAATVTGAAQAAITSLGSLTGLDINGAMTINDNLLLDGDNKELRFYEGANYVGFKAPALAGNQIWVLPIEDGSTGNILKTNGSGTLSWTTNISGASSLDEFPDVLNNTSAANLVVGHIPGNITSGTSNSAFSQNSLDDLTSGAYNNAFGSGALAKVTTGNANTAMGHKAMESLVGGAENTAFGQGAMITLTTGGNNTAVGVSAGIGNQTGSYNTFVGYEAGNGTGNNSSNTAVGYQAGKGITTGADNVFIGKSAGNTIDDGSSNVVIGDDADVSATNSSNQIVIGKGATGQGNNYAVIGNAQVTRVYAAQDGEAVLYADATIVSSDERLKENIKSITHGLDFIKKLNPVSYDKMQVSDFLNNKTPNELKFEIGLLAQQVKKASESINFKSNIVTIDEDGIYRMDYQKITMPLIKAVQEQQVMIDSLKKIIEDQNKRFEKIESLLLKKE